MREAQLDELGIGDTVTSTAAPMTIALTEADAGFVYFSLPGTSMGIHLEVHVSGRLQPERLLSAARAACERHPIARASMIPLQRGDRVYRWKLHDRVTLPYLEVMDCADERSLNLARTRVLESPPRLDLAPPFSLRLLHRPEGDTLIVYIHHAATDGLGSWRFITSILRAYAGVEDPVPAFDPLLARELRPLVVPGSRKERWRRLSKVAALIAGGSRPVRIVPQGAGGHGEGVFLMSLDEQETTAVLARRSGRATLNDVMLAGLALAIRRWNAARDDRSGMICLTVPVNLRPPHWANEVVGNLASFMPVPVPKSDTDDFDGLVAAVAKRTQKAKEDYTAQALFDVIPTLMRRLSVHRKRRLGLRMRKQLECLQDTTVFSNLGRVDLPELGEEAGCVTAAWATSTATFTTGFMIAALSLKGRLQLSFRYKQNLFDGGAAAEFAELYRSILIAEEARTVDRQPRAAAE
jgi:NRPS condensation-like uncharacterized protein